MKDDKIKPGDVVQLKSGGPLMTVGEMGPSAPPEKVDSPDPLDFDPPPLGDGECACVWFAVRRIGGPYTHDARARFHVDSLRKAESFDQAGDDAPDSLPPDSGPARRRLTIKVIRRTDDDDHEGHATIEIHDGAVKLADGYIGGEPEDNRITRDYSWIVPAIESVAKHCGAEVSIETSEEA